MFRFFERLLDPTAATPEATPPAGLLAFYWHYAKQVRGLILLLFVAGFLVAELDTAIPVFIGRMVSLLSSHGPQGFLADAWPQLLGMALIMLVARPAVLLFRNLVTNQVVAPGLTNMIRWQTHWHVVRQSWTFVQNDFAGRIANRIMQTGPSLRESVVQSAHAVLYIIVYGGSAIVLLSSSDLRLATPILVWFLCYATLLRIFVPRLRDRS